MRNLKIIATFLILILSTHAAEFVAVVPQLNADMILDNVNKGVEDFQVVRRFRAFGENYVVVESSEKSAFAVSALTHQGLIGVEPNQKYQMFGGAKPPAGPGDLSDFKPRPVLSNDSQLTSQWGVLNYGQRITALGLRGIDAAVAQAWTLATGSSKITVAIMDSGVDYNHEDLQGNLWSETVNGKVTHGFDAIESKDVMDNMGHGTHVAGIIGARGNNGKGVAGVNWNTRMVSVRIFSHEETTTDAVLKGLDWIYSHRGEIRAVNHSWGGGDYSALLESAFQKVDRAGVLQVIAAGNGSMKLETGRSDGQGTMYPAMYDLKNSIVVASHDNRGQRSSFSNFGEQFVDITAPGSNIYSTYMGNVYASLSGTSMATPFVTGAIALLLSKEPTLTAAQVKKRILDRGTVTPTLKGVSRGAKRLNVYGLFN